MDRIFIFSIIYVLLQVTSGAPSVTIQPETQIVRSGDSVKILCKAQTPIVYCRFVVPGLGNLNLAPTYPTHKGSKYFGNGFDQGECGIEIGGVHDSNNGYINCTFGVSNNPVELSASMKLTVAKPPLPPILEVAPGRYPQGAYKEEEYLQASCRIENSRPVASISWFIDGEQISSGLSSIQRFEGTNDLYSIMQNLTIQLKYTHNGRNLRCVTTHLAQGPESINQTLYKLNVIFPPKPSSREYEKFGFTIGEAGDIKVVVHANPMPEFTWEVGNEILKDNAIDSTGRLRADHAYKQSDRHWEAILRINKVTEEEVDKRYNLYAKNDLGQASYNIVISTSPAPRTSALTTTAIAGIIVAILVIILLLFMIIFARATGRWCFAGGVAPRQTAESSSTRKKKKRNTPESLTYIDYKLVIDDHGKKKYVSPEEAARIETVKTVAALNDGKFQGPSKSPLIAPSIEYVQVTNEQGKKEYVTLDEAKIINEKRMKESNHDVASSNALPGILRKAPLPPLTLNSRQSDSFKSVIRSSATTNYDSPIESSVDYVQEDAPMKENILAGDDVDGVNKASTCTEMSLAGIPKVSKDVKVSDWLKEHREAGDLKLPAATKEIQDVRDLLWMPHDLPPPVPSSLEHKKSSVTVPLSSPKEVRKAEEKSEGMPNSRNDHNSDSTSDEGKAKKLGRGWSEGSKKDLTPAMKRSIFGGIFSSGKKARKITKLDVEFSKSKDGTEADSESSDSETSSKRKSKRVKKSKKSHESDGNLSKKPFLVTIFGSRREKKVQSLERSLSEPGKRKDEKDSFSVGDDRPDIKVKSGKNQAASEKRREIGDAHINDNQKKTSIFFPLFKSRSSDALKVKNKSSGKSDEKRTKGLGWSDSELWKPKKRLKKYIEVEPAAMMHRTTEHGSAPIENQSSHPSSTVLYVESNMKGDELLSRHNVKPDSDVTSRSDGEEINSKDSEKKAKNAKRRFSFPFSWGSKGKKKNVSENTDETGTDNELTTNRKAIEHIRIDSVEPDENVIVVDDTNIKSQNDDEEAEIMAKPYLSSFLSIFTPLWKPKVLADGDYYKKTLPATPVVVTEVRAESVKDVGSTESISPVREKNREEKIDSPTKSVGDIVKEILGSGAKNGADRALSKKHLSVDSKDFPTDSEQDKMRDIVNEIFKSASEDSEKEEKKRKKGRSPEDGSSKKMAHIFGKKSKKNKTTYIVSKNRHTESCDSSSDSDAHNNRHKRKLRQERSFEEASSSDESEKNINNEVTRKKEGRKKPLKTFFGLKGTYKKNENLDFEDKVVEDFNKESAVEGENGLSEKVVAGSDSKSNKWETEFVSTGKVTMECEESKPVKKVSEVTGGSHKGKKGLLALFGSKDKVPSDDDQSDEVVKIATEQHKREKKLAKQTRERKSSESLTKQKKGTNFFGLFRSNNKVASEDSSVSSDDEDRKSDVDNKKISTEIGKNAVENATSHTRNKEDQELPQTEKDKKIIEHRNSNMKQLKSFLSGSNLTKNNKNLELSKSSDNAAEFEKLQKQDGEVAKESQGTPSRSAMLRLIFGSKELQEKRSSSELRTPRKSQKLRVLTDPDSGSATSVTSIEEPQQTPPASDANNKPILSFLRPQKQVAVESSNAEEVRKGFFAKNILKANKKNRRGFYEISPSDDPVESPKKETSFSPYFLPRNSLDKEEKTSTSSAEIETDDLIIARPAVGVWGPKRRTKSWEFDEENEPVILKSWKQFDDEGQEVKVAHDRRKRPSSLLVTSKNEKPDKDKNSRPLSLFDAHMTRLSDTESADHGSTDKSSVAKLTQERSNKLKFGFLDLLKRPKDKVRDIEDLKVVAEAKESELSALDSHGHTNADGVVYAELDIVRNAEVPPRAQPEPEKTEYAEIIHPNSRATKKANEDLRKSRENLAGSREALNDPDPDVITTPEGKKEAAV